MNSLRSLFPGVLPLFMLAHLAHHLVPTLPIPLLPFIRDEFALDYTRAGFVISAFGVVYGISQLPAGWLADRLGPHIVITIISICGVAVTGFLVGFSQTYTMLIIFLVLMGVLGGGYHPAATTLISSTVETKTLGRAMGFHMTGGSVSYFLVPLIAAGIAAIWGWRGTFITLSIPTLIFGIIFYIFLQRQSSIKKAKSEAADSYQETTITRKRFSRPITIITLSTLVQATLISVVSLLPLYMVDHFNASKETAAASVSLIYSVGLWVGPLGGYLSDRMGRVLILLATCLFAGPAIYLLNLTPYGWGIGIVLVIIGILIYANATVAQAYIVDQTSERNRSTILGIFFFGTMEGSGITTPLIGYSFDKFGFYSSFSIIGAALLASTLISLVLLRIWRD